MKIDGTNSLSGKLEVGFGEEAPSVQERSGASSEGAESQISLSQSNIQSLKAQLDSLPEVREGRVQALRQSVKNGSYKVDNYQLADAMAAEFFGPGGSGKS